MYYQELTATANCNSERELSEWSNAFRCISEIGAVRQNRLVRPTTGAQRAFGSAPASRIDDVHWAARRAFENLNSVCCIKYLTPTIVDSLPALALTGRAVPRTLPLQLKVAMNRLIHCIYSSAATGDFAEHDIPQLLEKTRAANASRGITGMLLYVEGSFFQVLEGDGEPVDALFQKISADSRHKHVTLIIREPIPERSFGEWSMGFATLGRSEAGELVGQNDFFTQASCFESLNPGRAKKLLAAFRRGRWHAEHTGNYRPSVE
jgi:hypothetical protein